MESAVIDLDVTNVAHGGVFVGRHGADGRGLGADGGGRGRVVFVPDAIPGERVRVRLTDTSKASFWRGETLEILDASPHRRPHVWRQADVEVPPQQRPGGADFGHIDLAHQRRLKLDVLQDALRRFGGIDLPVSIEPTPDETADGTGWRTRIGLHVDADGRVGPFAARSHRVVTVEDHPLATAGVERAARRLERGPPGRIDLVQPADGRVRIIARPEGTKTTPAEARETVVERVVDREFRVAAGGFWQVHRRAAVTLDAAVRDALRTVTTGGALDPDAWHLDLYGGVGLFAAALADLGGSRVTSVESDPRATDHAGENLAEWVGARAETARVDRFVARLVAAASARERERLARGVIVLDPPRSGARREVVESVAALQPSAVVYVACDPVALARDAATFRAAGYEPQRITAHDLFPNSHHVEAVATFLPAAPSGAPAG